MPGEYEEDNPLPGQDEDHTFVTTFEPRKHRSAPLPPGAEECIKNELNQVEQHLDLTKTTQPQGNHSLEDDFPETIKEQQVRRVMETQFEQNTPPTTIGTQEQNFEQLIESSPLAKIANLKEENRQWQITRHLDTIEHHLTPQKESHPLPTPPDTPPPKASERFQTLGDTLKVNKMTAATQ
jgi:hypothetical protein